MHKRAQKDVKSESSNAINPEIEYSFEIGKKPTPKTPTKLQCFCKIGKCKTRFVGA